MKENTTIMPGMIRYSGYYIYYYTLNNVYDDRFMFLRIEVGNCIITSLHKLPITSFTRTEQLCVLNSLI